MAINRPSVGMMPLFPCVVFLFVCVFCRPIFASAVTPQLGKHQHFDDDNELLLSDGARSVDRQEIVVDILRGSPATNNDDDRRRSLQYDDGCPDSLSTPLNPTSGSYGNVFSVRTVEGGPSVLVTSLDFYTDQNKMLEYEVYTLPGLYKDLSTGRSSSLGDISQWTLVASGRVMGEGSDRVTPIPRDEFLPVEIDGDGAFQSFYVTLTTPDIRYRPGTGSTDLREIYAATDELELIEGVGVILYPMPANVANFLAPRRFLGTIHYTSADTCPPAPTPRPTPAPTRRPTAAPAPLATTRVLYTFTMQHDANVDQENLLAGVDDVIESTLSRIMETTGTNLNSFADGDDLAVRGVVSFPVSSDAECTASAPDVCTDLAITVSVSHRTSASQADIRNAMLEEDVIATLAANLPLSSAYTGDLSVQADMILNLDGVPSAEMNADETALLERVTLDFLRTRLDGDYTITDAHVFGQNLVSAKTATTLSPAGDNVVLSGRHRKHADEGGRALRAPLRLLQSSSAGSLEVSVRITGESRNPRKRDLEQKVEDTIDSEGERFSNDLREAAEMDPVVSRSSYFDDILPVTSKPVDGPNTSPVPAPQVNNSNGAGNGKDGGPPIGIIIGAIVGGVLAIAVAAFLYIKGVFGGKSKQQKEFQQQFQSYWSSERFDQDFGDDAYKSFHSAKNKSSYQDEKMARRSSFGGSGGGGPLPSDVYAMSSYDLASKGHLPAKASMGGGATDHGAVSQKNKAAYDLERKMQNNGPSNARIQNKLAYNGAGAPPGAAPRRASGTAPRRSSGTAPRRSSGTRGGPRRGSSATSNTSGSRNRLPNERRRSSTSNTSGGRNRLPNERRRSSSGDLSTGFLGEEDLHFR